MRDPFVSSHVLSCTPNPQQLCWLALHQDYSSEPVYNHKSKLKFVDHGMYADDVVDEAEYGRRLIDNCVKFGHWGVTEHPQITVNCVNYPHSVMQQARTHRVGISFDVQSFRYTSKSFLEVDVLSDVERVVYFRPVGHYTDRQGKRYDYTEDERSYDIEFAYQAIKRYQRKIALGYSEEHARGNVPFDLRQHFVVSFNARSLMHFLDLRAKADAQLEIQWLAEDLMSIFENWMPELAAYYRDKRWKKARLSP